MKNQCGTIRFVIITLTLLTILGTVAAACSSGNKTNNSSSSTTNVSSGVSFAKDIQPIFNNNCVICHQGQVAAQASLTLEPKLSYSNLVGMPSTESATELRVKPGSPDQSYIIAKLQGTQVQAGGSGARMPYGAPSISLDQINLIQQWIAEGAPNN